MSRWIRGSLVALGLLVGTSPVAVAEETPAGAQPLPLKKSTTVRGRGTTWIVDGPTVIPKAVELRIELGTTILGINNASLDVQGGLKVHGTQGEWVVMKNIDFSPTKLPKHGVHLDMVDLHHCKFDHGADGGFDGQFTLENARVHRTCTFKFRTTNGFVRLMTVAAQIAMEIHAAPPEKKLPIEVSIRSSWMPHVLLTGPSEATVRHCELKGGIECRNVHEVIIDGCDVRHDIVVKQAAAELFKKVKLTKCNMFGGAKVILERPKGEDTKKEYVKLDKFYFGPDDGGTGPLYEGKKVAEVVKDGADLPKGEGSVFAKWGKVKKRKHVLVNYDLLMQRVPPRR